jgi:hypothetical protein
VKANFASDGAYDPETETVRIVKPAGQGSVRLNFR